MKSFKKVAIILCSVFLLLAALVAYVYRTDIHNKYILSRAVKAYSSFNVENYEYRCNQEALQSSTSKSIEIPKITFVALAPTTLVPKEATEQEKQAVKTAVFIDYICKEPLADGLSIFVDDQRYDYPLDNSQSLYDEFFGRYLITYGFVFVVDESIFTAFKRDEESSVVKLVLTQGGKAVSSMVELNKTTHLLSENRESSQYVYPWKGEFFSLDPRVLETINE